ncbi:MAG: hypothetical protein V4605_07675 [Pseudomonadota bacterium]
MNRNNSLFINRFRFLNLDGLIAFFHQKTALNIASTNTRLLKLCGLLTHWNIQRISANNIQKRTQVLSIEDIQALKTLIQAEINKTDVKHPVIIADQLLFLSIGAIQIESQNGSDAAWQLVHKTILSFNQPASNNQYYAFGFLALLVMMCASIFLHNPTKTQTIETTPLGNFTMTKVVNRTDPVTISMLQRAYAKMQAGTCRLTQPDSLPPEQQRAFLTFVNDGVIDVHHVENLRLAIDYVNCLYPQEFLHPTPSYGNTL